MAFPESRDNSTMKRHFQLTAVTALVSITLLSGCGSSDPISAATAGATGDSVSDAVADFPDSLLPRFALNNSEVIAAEVFRRMEVSSDGSEVTSWGVEGISSDETAERESRYGTDGVVLENIRAEPVDTMTAIVESTVRARYPDAPVVEIERTDADGVIAWAVLLDANGAEAEVNVADDGTYLFLEEEIVQSDLPASVAAALSRTDVSGASNLPDSGFERVTFADGAVQYSVEYESDLGQSLTVVTDDMARVLKVEHEDSLVMLSTSDTVQNALAAFPDNIAADFATGFPQVTAAEVFRSQAYTDGVVSSTLWGIEGLSEDETLEVEAMYSATGERLESATGRIIESLPTLVADAFALRYPEGAIEEITEAEDVSGITYAIAFMLAEEELEANYDASGNFLSLETLLAEDQIPAALLQIIGMERVVLPIVEFEAVDAADGSRTFVVEYENETGDSISYKLSGDAVIQSIDHEAPFTP